MEKKQPSPEDLQEKEVQLYFLRNFVELSTDIFCNLDRNGYCLYINEGFERITGFRPKDIVGTHFRDYLHPEDMDKTFQNFQKHLAGTHSDNGLLNRIRTREGKYVYIEWIGKNDDHDHSVFLVGRNVTDRVLAEQKLLVSQQRMQAIFDNVSLSFILFDTSGIILAFNKRMEEKMRFVTGKFLKEGLNIREFLLENYSEDFDVNFPRVLAGERVMIERKLKTHRGLEFWTEGSYNPVFDENRKVTAIAMVLGDITQKKRAEEEIKRLSLVATNASNSIIICNRDRKIEWVNKGFTRITGYLFDEVIGKDPIELLYGESSNWQAISRISRSLRMKEEIKETVVNYDKNGNPYWMDLIISPVFNSENNVTHFISIGTDVTDKIKHQLEIMEKNKLFASISQAMPVVIYIYNVAASRLEFISDYISNITGYTLEEITSKQVDELTRLVHEEDLAALKASMSGLVQKGMESTSNSFRVRHKTSGLRKVSSKETIYKRDEKGNVTHVLGSILDVTEQYSAERYKEAITRLQNLQLKKTQKIRSLSLLQGQEEERKRLSRELHDGIGQLLTAIRIKLNDIEGITTENKELSAKFEDVKSIVLKTIKETRNISNALVPIDLYDFGLDPALKRLADAAGQTAGIEVLYNSNLEVKRLNPTIEIELFRIVQEALNNSVKYSKAGSIDINIGYSEKNGNLKVLIIDDGQGFDYDPDYIYKKNITRSYGIRNMNERARIINGKLTIISKKGQGCVISVEVPLKLKAP